MAITDPLVLPADVLLVPVADLSEDVRRQLDHDEGDYAVTRPRSRTPSRIVDAGAAELLQQFRNPCRIVDAVIRFSREREIDPETTLEEAYPLIERLLASGFLVAEGEAGADAIRPLLAPGDEIAGFEVIENIQVLEDTELYQVRRTGSGHAALAALKIERPAAAGKSGGAFEREAAVLARLDGRSAPRLLEQGEIDGRSYLAIEWLPGIDGYAAAAELRRRGDLGRAGLLRLGRSILAAYERLHESGFVHGDVHPRNVIAAADGEVRLIDFGLAQRLVEDEGAAEQDRPWRGGVAFFFEPEYAAAVRRHETPPPATPAGEQFAIAAVLYLLLTGAHYRDFSLDKEGMLRQIHEEPPLPFAERGAAPWPEVEAVLARALAKEPGDRFASTAEMARAWEAIPEPEARDERRPSGSAPSRALAELLARVLERLAPEGELFRAGLPAPPRLSVNYGAAGFAYALYRIAQARDDAALIAVADLWGTKAVAGGAADDGFFNPEMDLTAETVGRISPYHSPSGPRCVQALIAHALGQPGAQRQAIYGFLEAARGALGDRADLDVTLGRSGVVLASSILLGTLRGATGRTIMAGDDAAVPLRELGDGLLRGIWEELDALPPIPVCDASPNLGIAHGWAGYLYAALRWCRATGAARPARLEERLAELAECAQTWGRGARWRWLGEGTDRKTSATMPGWCNGSAGFVFLWTLAHEELGDPRWATLAESAAWNTWEAPEGTGSLCCGLAGRSYALLDLWRRGGGEEWLDRARDLADRAAQEIVRYAESADSLYKGQTGVAVLAADLGRPEAAAMPLFGEEGW
jgi:serine/threonine-protein kinase